MPKDRTGQPGESKDVETLPAEEVKTEAVAVVEADEETLIYDPQPKATLSMDAPAGTPVKVAAYAVQMYLHSGAFKRSE
jgi:hypothetical protein